MFANRYTAFLDACCMVPVLKRNLLLSLAEAEFFRVRWSDTVMDETERAVEKLLLKIEQSANNAREKAARSRAAMEAAFPEATVTGFQKFLPTASCLPDPDDAHVLAAALSVQASTIVTDNLKHFPEHVLKSFNIEAKSADAFIADTIMLDEGRAVAAIRRMHGRFNNPPVTAAELLLKMEALGMTETVDVLREHESSL